MSANCDVSVYYVRSKVSHVHNGIFQLDLWLTLALKKCSKHKLDQIYLFGPRFLFLRNKSYWIHEGPSKSVQVSFRGSKSSWRLHRRQGKLLFFWGFCNHHTGGFWCPGCKELHYFILCHSIFKIVYEFSVISTKWCTKSKITRGYNIIIQKCYV